MSEYKLLPCPFCGGEAKIILIGNDHTKKRKAEVSCMTVGCSSKQTVAAILHDHNWCEQQAIAAWNQRPSHWVSVDDRLPDHGQDVVASGIPDGDTKHSTIELTYSRAVGFIENIEYWIPLPSPPEKD